MVFQIRAEVDSQHMLKKKANKGISALVNAKVYHVSITADFAYLHDFSKVVIYDGHDRLVYYGPLINDQEQLDMDLLNSLAACVPREEPYSRLERFTSAQANVFLMNHTIGTITLEAKIAYSKPNTQL
jgi:hypothetical protein